MPNPIPHHAAAARRAALPGLFVLAAAALAACTPPVATPGTPPAGVRPLPLPPPAAPAPVSDGLPAPRAGLNRHVLNLPPRTDVGGRQIELVAGRTITVDCNRHGMQGRFEAQPWPERGADANFWVLQGSGQIISTRMGCPPGTERSAFVGTQPLFVPYRSEPPLVLFVPQGQQVRYRLDPASPWVDVPMR